MSTGYTVHTGSNEKFTTGFDAIFKKKPAAKKKTSAKAPTKKVAKKGKK